MKRTSSDRPYFLWDYNLNEKQVQTIITKGDETSRRFLITRILESANYDDVWKYIQLSDLVKVFPQLKLKKPVYRAWEYALKTWGVL